MLLPESSNMAMSPARISFSYDLGCQSDATLPEHRLSLSGSADFDFCVRRSFDHDSSSADELFSDGKILPTEMKKKKPKSQHPPDAKQRSEAEEKQSNKSFWGFKRSSSLNCGNGYGPSLCPLPILSRSNSTGSSTSVKNSPPSLSLKQKSACYQKPPVKKVYGSQRVNPVLNVNIFSIFSPKSKPIKK